MSNAIGKTLVFLIGMLAEFERLQVQERTIEGLCEKARQGQYPKKGKPFGYDKIIREDKYNLRKKCHYLEVNEQEKKILLDVYQMYTHQYLTDEQINIECEKYNLKIKSVYEFLNNTIYLGKVEVPLDSGNWYNICEPLFTTEMFDEIQNRRNYNLRQYGGKHQYKYQNMVIINNEPAKHQRQKEKSYYYRDKIAYIREEEIDKYIDKSSRIKDKKEKEKLEKELVKAAMLLSQNKIALDDFNKKYSELENRIMAQVKFKKIYIEVDEEGNKSFNLL